MIDADNPVAVEQQAPSSASLICIACGSLAHLNCFEAAAQEGDNNCLALCATYASSASGDAGARLRITGPLCRRRRRAAARVLSSSLESIGP